MELAEDTVEEAALDWLRDTGYSVLSGETIAPGVPLPVSAVRRRLRRRWPV